MKRALAFLVAALLVLTAGAALAADGRPSKTMEYGQESFDRVAHFRQMTDLQQRLSSVMVDLAASAPLVVAVSADELRAVRNGMAVEKKMRVGVVKELAIPMAFSREEMVPFRAALHSEFGAIRGAAGGAFHWTGLVRSPEASAVRIHLTDVDLPEGAELYVQASNGMAFGPYTGKGPNGTGDFWTNTVAGAEIVLQLNAGGAGNPRFTVAGVGHMTSEFSMSRVLAPVVNAANTKPCSFNADCTVDAACVSTNAAVNTARDAVAHILFASGAYLYICSGGLIADSDTATRVPYFMTANHCISRASEASSMETFFFYRATSCGGCPDPGAANTTGSSIIAGNRTSDYTLLRLSQAAPTAAAFLGWTSATVANTNGAALYRLSHPKGSPQAYSEHVVDTTKGTCRSWPRGSWIYSRDILGATEGGSSGSSVVNGQGQFVGQLSGGCGTNVNDVCDAQNNATVDGAFAAYYDAVSQFLGAGSGGGCTDADGDGVCAAQDCNDNNKEIYPGHSEKGKFARDGLDNDCNGVIDG